jgi:hypothetical protein
VSGTSTEAFVTSNRLALSCAALIDCDDGSHESTFQNASDLGPRSGDSYSGLLGHRSKYVLCEYALAFELGLDLRPCLCAFDNRENGAATTRTYLR